MILVLNADLIRAVRSFPVLYSNPILAEQQDGCSQVWKIIEAHMRDKGHNITAVQCHYYWQLLKRRFKQEKLKLIANAEGGLAQSSWRLYSLMSFLETPSVPARAYGNKKGVDVAVSPIISKPPVEVSKRRGVISEVARELTTDKSYLIFCRSLIAIVKYFPELYAKRIALDGKASMKRSFAWKTTQHMLVLKGFSRSRVMLAKIHWNRLLNAFLEMRTCPEVARTHVRFPLAAEMSFLNETSLNSPVENVKDTSVLLDTSSKMSSSSKIIGEASSSKSEDLRTVTASITASSCVDNLVSYSFKEVIDRQNRINSGRISNVDSLLLESFRRHGALLYGRTDQGTQTSSLSAPEKPFVETSVVLKESMPDLPPIFTGKDVDGKYVCWKCGHAGTRSMKPLPISRSQRFRFYLRLNLPPSQCEHSWRNIRVCKNHLFKKTKKQRRPLKVHPELRKKYLMEMNTLVDYTETSTLAPLPSVLDFWRLVLVEHLKPQQLCKKTTDVRKTITIKPRPLTHGSEGNGNSSKLNGATGLKRAATDDNATAAVKVLDFVNNSTRAVCALSGASSKMTENSFGVTALELMERETDVSSALNEANKKTSKSTSGMNLLDLTEREADGKVRLANLARALGPRESGVNGAVKLVRLKSVPESNRSRKTGNEKLSGAETMADLEDRCFQMPDMCGVHPSEIPVWKKIYRILKRVPRGDGREGSSSSSLKKRRKVNSEALLDEANTEGPATNNVKNCIPTVRVPINVVSLPNSKVVPAELNCQNKTAEGVMAYVLMESASSEFNPVAPLVLREETVSNMNNDSNLQFVAQVSDAEISTASIFDGEEIVID